MAEQGRPDDLEAAARYVCAVVGNRLRPIRRGTMDDVEAALYVVENAARLMRQHLTELGEDDATATFGAHEQLPADHPFQLADLLRQ